MEYAFSIVTFVFAGLLLLCALGLYTGFIDAYPKQYAAKGGKTKAYRRRLAAVLAFTALGPAASGAVALIVHPGDHPLPAVLTLILGTPLSIFLGCKLTKKQ